MDIFTEDGIFTLFTIVIFSLILKKIETSISYLPYFTFFGKTLTVFSVKIYITFEKIDTVSACEIYEALSAILWDVGRQRAPIFFRDHFLRVFLKLLIVQS